ncbi:MAG: YccF domain-containing protein [Bacteroidales bacterium]|nr:YccF domain-containing protein [Bacteroidales bacterium]MDD4669414.1 YccF domain-containing protein [Bacteroidales bacterium]
MSLIGNILWLIFGGLAIAAEYCMAGVVACCTIVGIPWGLQLFKIATLSLVPFGQHVVLTEPRQIPGCLAAILNILWIVTGGLIISLTHIIMGLLLCITIIGIPFGLQHFKLVSLAMWPWGRRPQ